MDTIENYSVIKKKGEILTFMTTWMDLEGIMLSEIDEKNKHCVIYSYIVCKN